MTYINAIVLTVISLELSTAKNKAFWKGTSTAYTSQYNVINSLVQGLRYAYQGTKVGLLLATRAILAGCPSYRQQ